MQESLEVKQYYIWESTSLKGTPEIYLAQNESLIFFESGRTVEVENFEMFLSKITEEEFQNSKSSQEILYNPYENIPLLGNPNDPIIYESVSQRVEQDPIQIILDKQKKLEEIELDLKVTLKLPTKKVIEFLTLMFDEEEVFSTLSKSTLSQINESEIKEMIKIAILNHYTDVS